MRLLIGPAADFPSLLHINHFVFATKKQRLIFIRNRKLNVLFKIEEKKENLSENYGLDMDRDLGKEIDDNSRAQTSDRQSRSGSGNR